MSFTKQLGLGNNYMKVPHMDAFLKYELSGFGPELFSRHYDSRVVFHIYIATPVSCSRVKR